MVPRFVYVAFALGQVVALDSHLSYSQQLFVSNLELANRSLDGRFVRELADGSLASAAFQRYLLQDNLYLSKYARAFARLAATTEYDEEFVWLSNQSVNYLYEHHRSSNRTEADFERQAMPVTVAYTDLFVEAAAAGDRLLEFAVLLPCQHLYDYIFKILADRGVVPSNPYKNFIEQYALPSNHQLTKRLEGYFDRAAAGVLSSSRAERVQHYYSAALEMEARFFDQALHDGAIAEPLIIVQ
eukprot:TRINITY_DN66537_c0_g1_i1.p1 TRINITY_DN66537_c0_g1~~TRINITY_DN66537_c0_g1_i1.p1  ORF type:complete len:242 (-),score=45.07 TRINITY_DN66537_c0_g1_i1:29-754(-)